MSEITKSKRQTARLSYCDSDEALELHESRAQDLGIEMWNKEDLAALQPKGEPKEKPEDGEVPAKRKRGRPRKKTTEVIIIGPTERFDSRAALNCAN
jgi:hypothetical protein